MKKIVILICLGILFKNVYPQDIIYTISGLIETDKVRLDSILFENLTNKTRLLFFNLPPQQDYRINLTSQENQGETGMDQNSDHPDFYITRSAPGEICISTQSYYDGNINLKVHNIQGQLVYSAQHNDIGPGNSLNIILGIPGLYIVSVESATELFTTRAIGNNQYRAFSSFSQGQSFEKSHRLKSDTKGFDEDFKFKPGDSLRISVYKNGYFTRPQVTQINQPENFEFNLEISKVSISGVSDAFIILDKQDSIITDFNYVTGDIQMNMPIDSLELFSGDILAVDADTTGFLRKIVSTSEEDGILTVRTEQAYLDEVFVDIGFTLNTELIEPSGNLKSQSTLLEVSEALTDNKGHIHPLEIVYFDNSGTTVSKSAITIKKADGSSEISIIDFNRDLSGTDLIGNSGQNLHFSINEGYVSLKTDAVFTFDFEYKGELTEKTKVKRGSLNSFEFYLLNQAGFKSIFGLTIAGSYDKEETRKLINIKKATAKFIVPPGIPVWITFDCDIYGKYQLHTNASLTTGWGFESNHWLKAGGTYTKATGDLIPIYNYHPDNSVFPLSLSGELNANARFELYPRVDIKFYNFFGPYAELAPFIEGYYNSSSRLQSTNNGNKDFLAWNSGIDLGLDLRVGAELSFLGLFNKDFGPININCFNTPLWDSPADIELVSTLASEVEEGSTQTLIFEVTDMFDLPVSGCPIVIKGDGNFDKDIGTTDIDGRAEFQWTIGSYLTGYNLIASIYDSENELISSVDKTVTLSGSTLPVVITSMPGNITSSSAVVGGNVTSDGGFSVTESGIYWGTSVEPEVTGTKLSLSNGLGSFSNSLSGLDTNTTYYYIAYATNSSGTAFGDQMTFTTKTQSSGSLTNIALSSLGATAEDNGSFVHYSAGDLDAVYTIDDDTITHWAGLESSGDQIMWINFDKTYRINKIFLKEKSDAFIKTGFIEYYSGGQWVKLVDIDKSTADFLYEFTTVETDSVRLTITSIDCPFSWSNKVAIIYSFEVYQE